MANIKDLKAEPKKEQTTAPVKDHQEKKAESKLKKEKKEKAVVDHHLYVSLGEIIVCRDETTRKLFQAV